MWMPCQYLKTILYCCGRNFANYCPKKRYSYLCSDFGAKSAPTNLIWKLRSLSGTIKLFGEWKKRGVPNGRRRSPRVLRQKRVAVWVPLDSSSSTALMIRWYLCEIRTASSSTLRIYFSWDPSQNGLLNCLAHFLSCQCRDAQVLGGLKDIKFRPHQPGYSLYLKTSIPSEAFMHFSCAQSRRFQILHWYSMLSKTRSLWKLEWFPLRSKVWCYMTYQTDPYESYRIQGSKKQ